MGLFWQKAGFCTGPRLYVVVFTVDDVLWPVVYRRRWQFIDVDIDRGGCWGPSDAESCSEVQEILLESYFLVKSVSGLAISANLSM